MNKTLSAVSIALVTLPLAYAAQTTVDPDPNGIALSTWFWVAGFSLLGWVADSLPKLAGWTDVSLNGGNLFKTRLEIMQGIFSSLLFGIGIYFLGKSSPRWLGWESAIPEMTLFVMVGAAGYAGSRGLEWARGRFFKQSTP